MLGDVRRDAMLAAPGDETSGVVAPVGAERRASAEVPLDHLERGLSLREAVGLADPQVDE